MTLTTQLTSYYKLQRKIWSLCSKGRQKGVMDDGCGLILDAWIRSSTLSFFAWSQTSRWVSTYNSLVGSGEGKFGLPKCQKIYLHSCDCYHHKYNVLVWTPLGVILAFIQRSQPNKRLRDNFQNELLGLLIECGACGTIQVTYMCSWWLESKVWRLRLIWTILVKLAFCLLLCTVFYNFPHTIQNNENCPIFEKI